MNNLILFRYGGLGGAELMIIFIVLLIALVPVILYLINLQKTMEQVSPELRKMSPGQVWLMLIPVFGVIWNFIMVGNIADSLAAEYRKRNLPTSDPRPTYQTGLVMAICQACGWVPVLGGIASLVGLIFWIIYWVKTAEHKNFLKSNQPYFNPGTMNNNQQYYQQYNPQSFNQQQYHTPPNNQQVPPNYDPSQPPPGPGDYKP